MPLNDLESEDRLRLMGFVCSFAWADLEIADSERAMVARLVQKLDLDAEERRQVLYWLEVPPRPEDIDPMDVPLAHRQLFLDTIREMIEADGKVDEAEEINLELFQALLPD